MSKQEIKHIKVSDLKLWSENPRDPFDIEVQDFDVIKRAVDENPKDWNLDKLIKEMGNHFDLSEIPTVVYIDKAPVVFDGNRRIAVLKYLQDEELYSALSGKFFLKTEPKELVELVEIPCNVCDKDTALTNIERKHVNSGSWGAIQREYFSHYHRGNQKSLFLILEEQTGLISAYPNLNKIFVKDEVLNEKNLKEVGFILDGEKIVTSHTKEEQESIFNKINSLIEEKEINTRNNRGTLKETLIKKHSDIEKILEISGKEKSKEAVKIKKSNEEDVVDEEPKKQRKTPRDKKQKQPFFGEDLILNKGDVNSIYLDILDLHEFYVKKTEDLSKNFPAMIRMSLRLLIESALMKNEDIAGYVKKNYKDAKKTLSKDDKTTLSNNSIDGEKKMIQLLQSGAHNYTNSANYEQTVAMSIIIGAMLKITHGK